MQEGFLNLLVTLFLCLPLQFSLLNATWYIYGIYNREKSAKIHKIKCIRAKLYTTRLHLLLKLLTR